MLGGKESRGMVFLLKIRNGGSFFPSAQHAKTTVKWDFLAPVVLIDTDLSPLSFTDRPKGISNVRCTSSIFIMWSCCMSNLVFADSTNSRKLSSFSLKSAGNCWH